MSDLTSKYKLPYPLPGDAVATVDDTVEALAERLDMLLGETGSTTITPSAVDTQTGKRINYTRSYAALAPLVPSVQLTMGEGLSTSNVVQLWVTGEDATGFTLNIRSSTTTTRTIRWLSRP